MDHPHSGARLREAREARGLAQTEVAHTIGLNVDWLRDLETYDRELYRNISLAALWRLATILGVEPAYLLSVDRESARSARIPLADIVARIRDHMGRTGGTAAGFSDLCGWDVEPALLDSNAIWNWCPDELRDVCSVLDLDWVSTLPTGDPPVAVPTDA